MKESTEDRVKGTYHEAKGKVKETAGRITKKPELEADGTVEKLAGELEDEIGKVEQKMEKEFDE